MRFVIFSTVIALSCSGTSLAYGDRGRTYDTTLREIAKRISHFLKQKNETNIIPQFQGLADFPSGGEAGFQESLSEMLRGHGCRISNNAKYILSARTFRSKTTKNDLALNIRCQVLDQYGDVVVSLAGDTEVNDGEDVAQILGINSVFRPTDLGLSRLDDLSKERKKKLVYINDEGWVFSDKTGQYGMRILIDGKNQRVENGSGSERGLAFTSLPLGRAYTVELYNRSPHEVAVDLRIDGINSFHFCAPAARKPDGGPNYWIVDPGKTDTIRGWYITSSKSEHFETTTVDLGAASRAGLPIDKVGLVTATFHACWPGNGLPPRDEPSYDFWVQSQIDVPIGRNIAGATGQGQGLQGAGAPSDDISTGRGEVFHNHVSYRKREFGVARGVVALRYKRK